MRRKRLKHQADILCHMFRGWQLLGDYRTLTELGSGTLEINFLNEACRHNAKPIPTLSIVQAVSPWWRNDLAANNIPLDDIQEARLDVGRGPGQSSDHKAVPSLVGRGARRSW